MKPIGGFFDLELPKSGIGPHPDSISLSTGRSCMALWLREVRPSRCYVPFYCCDALVKPLVEYGIQFEFYEIDNQLRPVNLPVRPKSGEWLIWTNFFGLLGDQIASLAKAWRGRVLIDNTHAFFEARVPNLWSFTSARKYFGVPDGAYCYRPDGDSTPPLDIERFVPASMDYLVARYTCRTEEAFSLYQEAELALDSSLKRISRFSEHVLRGIDFRLVQIARATNYKVLAEQLQEHNTFEPVHMVRGKASFCYPFLPLKPIPRHELYERKFYIPTLWPDVDQRQNSGFTFERRLSRSLLPLPIDHRFQPEDMMRLAEFILDYSK